MLDVVVDPDALGERSALGREISRSDCLAKTAGFIIIIS